MPSSKAILDLEAWSNFLPPERSNDFEYNTLLYKFKIFLNEVKDFKELHSNCHITKSSALNTSFYTAESTSFSSTTADNSPASPTQQITLATNTNTNNDKLNFNSAPNSTNSTNNGQQVNVNQQNKKSSYFQQQHSVPPISGTNVERGILFRQQAFRNNSSQQHDAPNVQIFNSNYNISSMSNGNQYSTGSGSNRPEIKQRSQLQNSRLSHSKSSERLDSINNNILNSSGLNTQGNSFQSNRFNVPIERDDKYLDNEANIYDAVSPDDIQSSLSNVAASIQNLNRLSSLQQKPKLEPSKSTLGLDKGIDINRKTPSALKFPVSNSKSTPNWNSIEPDKSNNSFGSSIILDNGTAQSSSSLSQLTGLATTENESPNYANYVNIDFFLKRSDSPSFDGLEEEDTTNGNSSDDSDDETTHISNSLSSDQNGDVVLKDMSPREIVHKLSYRTDSPSSSITPPSSNDFLDDNRNSLNSQNNIIQHSPVSRQNETTTSTSTSKLANFFSMNNRDNESSQMISASPRQSSNKNSPSHQTLGPIHENATSFMLAKQSMSLDQGTIIKDGSALVEANNTIRSFLSELNLSAVDDMFEDKAQRRIVKESFAVEFNGRRKLRHLFLFNDVIVCAKYQASSKQKFTFDVKWYLNLYGVSILDLRDTNNQVKYDKEAIENQILGIRTSLMLLRGQMQHIKRSKHKQPGKVIKKLKKKRTELEAELVLLLPHLPLVIKHTNGKKYTFFLSSNFDRTQWIESIKFLQSQLPTAKNSSTSPSSSELQAWIQTCRKNLNPSLGTFLLRSNCDEDLLYGDLYVSLIHINGITKRGNYYFCFEVDSYGHFSQKASSSVVLIENLDHSLNEEYIFPLDGAHTLRILLYQDLGATSKPSVIGKAHIELSRAWFLDKPHEKVVEFNSNCCLTAQISYSSSELLSMRIPHTKLCPTFGLDITQVCKKEKTEIPLLIQLCVNEVERRGMREVGIYRMSGTSTDVQRLKKAFETNPYVAELLLRDIDINSVTGFLKTYLREMPEGLFSNKLYPRFVAAFNIPQSESIERTKKMLELFHMIPATNQQTIIYLVTHLVKVNKYESHNKMSLTNLATVLGPNILKPPTEVSCSTSSDPFTAVVIGSMSQAGILYFFLNRKFSNLPLTELDSSELIRSSGT